MNYNLMPQDFFKVIKQSWKRVLLIALAFAVIGGALPLLSSSQAESVSDEEIASNQKEIQAYEDWEETRAAAEEMTTDELTKSYAYLERSPWMSLDPYDCTYHELVFAFADEKPAAWRETIRAWIVEKYGDPDSADSDYLMIVDGTIGEVVVFVFKAGDSELDSAANDIEDYIVRKANEADITIVSVSNVKRSGFNQRLFDKQNLIRSNVVQLQNELSSYRVNNIMEEPARLAPQNEGVSVRRMVKYGILGLLLGACLAVLLSVYVTLRKGVLLSSVQVKEGFGLTELGTYDGENPEKTKLLSATLSVVIDKEAEILLFNDVAPEKCKALADDLNLEGGNKFVCSSGLSEDAGNAEQLLHFNGVIIPVMLGETTFNEIQHFVQWAHRFKKDVLGYVVIEA